MKRWHLEEMLPPMTPKKLILLSPGRNGSASAFCPVVFHQEPKIVVSLRRLAAFFIRFF